MRLRKGRMHACEQPREPDALSREPQVSHLSRCRDFFRRPTAHHLIVAKTICCCRPPSAVKRPARSANVAAPGIGNVTFLVSDTTAISFAGAESVKTRPSAALLKLAEQRREAIADCMNNIGWTKPGDPYGGTATPMANEGPSDQ